MLSLRVLRVVVALFAVSAASAYARSDDASASHATGGLSVASDPAGAAVYVDGQLAGETPFKTDAVTAGDHRVKIVKAGYLENARVVAVAAGTARDLRVKLTPDRSGSSTSVAPATGGGPNTWLWVALAGGGGAAAYFLATRDSGKPAVQTPTVSIVAPIVGVIQSFDVQASDPNGDPLTYAWDFGDGGTSTSKSPTHAFSAAGTFQVKVVVSDGNGHAVTSDKLAVTIKSLSGTWKGPINGQVVFNAIVTITQTGLVLSGGYEDQFKAAGIVSVGGSVNATTGAVTFNLAQPNVVTATFTGSVLTDGNLLAGTIANFTLTTVPWTLTRQ